MQSIVSSVNSRRHAASSPLPYLPRNLWRHPESLRKNRAEAGEWTKRANKFLAPLRSALCPLACHIFSPSTIQLCSDLMDYAGADICFSPSLSLLCLSRGIWTKQLWVSIFYRSLADWFLLPLSDFSTRRGIGGLT
jgi:hypothetical protein